MESVAPKLSLTVQYISTTKNVPTRAQFRRWFGCALQHDASITLRLIDAAEGLELNTNYRGKNYPTNVLTFVYDQTNELSGDVVMCVPIIEQEAAEQGKALVQHYAHLTIHAALHLQGYDHDNDVDATEMEALETALMLKLRYLNPYG